MFIFKIKQMKNIFTCLLLFAAALSGSSLQAQILSVSNGTEFSIVAGTTISAGGLELTPATLYSINNNTLIKSSNVNNSTSIVHISNVYQFNSTTNPYTGALKMYYDNGELNGLNASELKLLVNNGTSWSVDNNSISNTANNFVSNNSVNGASLREITAGVTPPIAVNNVKNVCTYIGTNQTLTYTASVSGASSYAWTLPANTQLVSGQGTRSIVIKLLNGFAAQANKQIKVTPAGGNLQIIYLSPQAPVTPATIVASSANICGSLGTNIPISFTIPKVYETFSNGTTTSSYIWTAQNGTTTISHPNGTGENDTTVSIIFASNFTSSNVSVQALNACGLSGTRSYFITRNNPSQPSLISGPTNTCEYIGDNGQVATYSVIGSVAVDSYTWTVPQGAIGFTGQGTSTISFKYPSGYTNGSISVTATNNCGTSASRSLSLSRLSPSTPGNIDVINTDVCPNRVYTYSVASIPSNATSMLWTVPASGTIVSGQGTRSISVSYPATVIDGYVTTKAVSNCGVSGMRTVAVRLAPCAATPTPQYTKGTINTTPSAMEAKVFPNPTSSSFNLQVTDAGSKEMKVNILDLQGKVIKSFIATTFQTNNIGSDLKPGVYIVEVLSGEEKKVIRVVKY